MNNSSLNSHNSNSQYLLALHSCSESFGIAIQNLENPDLSRSSKTFKIGRSLSNKLFTCIETLLPKEYWQQIVRIAVASGPGGFTTTRLTISMARAISQQIGCSLDGISTFQLMAARLHKTIKTKDKYEPFWIKNLLPRRGIIAGKYRLNKGINKLNFDHFTEIIPPKLFKNHDSLSPSIQAEDNVKEDILRLLDYSHFWHISEIQNSWEDLLPIYPTSPIE